MVTTRLAVLCAGVVLLLALPVAGDRRSGPPPEAITEAAASKAIDSLRAAFNGGACGSIYNEADAIFRGSESEEAWLGECENLREKLGKRDAYETRVGVSTSKVRVSSVTESQTTPPVPCAPNPPSSGILLPERS